MEIFAVIIVLALILLYFLYARIIRNKNSVLEALAGIDVQACPVNEGGSFGEATKNAGVECRGVSTLCRNRTVLQVFCHRP